MDRGAWRATVYGVARVEHDLATKPPPIKDTVVLTLLLFIVLLRDPLAVCFLEDILSFLLATLKIF